MSSVSFREAPSTDGTRIRYLQKGESIWIKEKVNAYWYKITDSKNVVGYVSTDTKYISTTYMPPTPPPIDPSAAAKKVIDAGLKYLGTPYEFGSDRSDTSTFDCSDFVRQAFLDGIQLKLPSDSKAQGNYVKEHNAIQTDWRQLQPGDLLFFMDYMGSKASDYAGVDKSKEIISHVGIYMGEGKMLHTYSVSSGGVRVDSIAGTAWEHRYLFGGSTLP